MKQDKVIDLELGKDGVYGPVRKDVGKPKSYKSNRAVANVKQVKNFSSSGEAFLEGIDYGLDFLENIVGRLDRFANIVK